MTTTTGPRHRMGTDESWQRRPGRPGAGTTWTSQVHTSASVSRSRRQLRALVAPSGPADADDVLALLLTYEELVSNAVRHGRPPVLVQVTTSARAWFIDVSDGAGDEAPTPAVDRDPAHGGLGLHVVARLTSEHGWSVEGSLKHVWARVERSATRS